MLLSAGKSITNFLSKIHSKAEAFFYGKIYPVILSLFAFLFWVADLQYVGLLILVVFGSFILIVFDDMLPTVPVLFLVPMAFRNTAVFNDDIAPYLYFIPAAIALVIHFIRFQRKPKFDLLCVGFVAIILAMLLGGVFSEHLDNYVHGFGFLFLSGVAMLAVHFVYTNRIHAPNKFDVGKYVSFALLIAVNLSCLQMIYGKIYVSLYDPTMQSFPFPGFCWANTNHIGNLILIAAPICCYLLLDAKNIFPYVINFIFFYVCVFLSKSDGSIYTLLLASPLMLYYTLINIHKKNYKALKLTYMTVIPAVILALTYLCLFDLEILTAFYGKATQDNYRAELYLYLWELFKENPIFGASCGHLFIEQQTLHNGYAHSTFFFAIGTTGLFGLLAFTLYYLLRMRLLAKNNTVLGSFALLAFVMFALYSLIDNGEFNVVLIYMTALITCVGLYNEKGNDFKPLPLKLRFHFYKLTSNVNLI